MRRLFVFSLLVASISTASCGGSEFSQEAAPTGDAGAAGAGGGSSGTGGSTAGTAGAGAGGANGGEAGAGAGGMAAGAGGEAGAGGDAGGSGAGAAGKGGKSGSGGKSGNGGKGGSGGAGAGGAGTGGAGAGGAGAGGAGAGAGGAGAGGAGTGGAGTAGAGAGGAGAGGAGAGGAGAAGTAGAAGNVGVETCLDGADNDADTLADCGDPDCQTTFACAPIPMGTALGVGFVDNKVDVNCPADFPNKTRLFEPAGLQIPANNCACECGAPATEECVSPLTCGALCTGGAIQDTDVGSTCSPVAGFQQGFSIACTAGKPVDVAGLCAPATPAPPAATTWTAAARSCVRAAGGSCPQPGQICVPKPPNDGALCLVLPGDVACPASAPKKTLYFDGKVVDTRACDITDCGCGAPAGGVCACGGACSLDVYSDMSCGGAAVTSFVPNGSTCSVLTPSVSGATAILSGSTVSKHAKCSPNGTAKATGSVEPKAAITTCCQ